MKRDIEILDVPVLIRRGTPGTAFRKEWAVEKEAIRQEIKQLIDKVAITFLTTVHNVTVVEPKPGDTTTKCFVTLDAPQYHINLLNVIQQGRVVYRQNVLAARNAATERPNRKRPPPLETRAQQSEHRPNKKARAHGQFRPTAPTTSAARDDWDRDFVPVTLRPNNSINNSINNRINHSFRNNIHHSPKTAHPLQRENRSPPPPTPSIQEPSLVAATRRLAITAPPTRLALPAPRVRLALPAPPA